MASRIRANTSINQLTSRRLSFLEEWFKAFLVVHGFPGRTLAAFYADVVAVFMTTTWRPMSSGFVIWITVFFATGIAVMTTTVPRGPGDADENARRRSSEVQTLS